MAIRDIGLEKQHAELLRGASLFTALDSVRLAKVAARLRVVQLDDGDELVRHGEPGDALYVISRGRFGVFTSEKARLRTCGKGEVIGEMALLTGSRRSATVRAEGEAEALRLDRDDFETLMASEPSVSRALATTLSSRLGGGEIAETQAAAQSSVTAEIQPLLTKRRATGLVLAAVGLGLGWLAPQPQGFSPEAWHAAATFVALVPLMVCDSLPEAAIAFVLVATWVLGGITTPEVALGGFATGSWVLTIAIFVIGAVIASSGVLFRVALWSVAHARGGFKAHALALCVTGWISSAAVPNPSGRILLVAPAISEMAEAFGYAPGSRGAAGLAMAALMGFGQTFAPFLTSSTTALLIFTLLPASSRPGLDWGTWAVRAAPTYLIVMAGMLAYIVWRYSPSNAHSQLRQNHAVPVQRALLGSVSRQEWLAGAVVVGLLLGFATQPLHHVDAAWIAVAALGGLAALGLVTSETLRQVNWNCALWFGVLASMVGVFSTTGRLRSRQSRRALASMPG